MKSFPTRVLFLCSFLLVFSKLPFALSEDKVPACTVVYKTAKAEMFHELDRLEGLYVHYKWLEQKIRLTAYHDLWKARQESLDPLSKEMRAEGNEEEDRLLDLLKDWDRESAETSNALWKGLERFPELRKSFLDCCPEKHYVECIEISFKPILDFMKTGLPLFDHILEREREYRKVVDLTTAGREGLYPEDALEEPSMHSDYFNRYEIERRARRFQDDQEIVRFFQEARKQLTSRFEGDHCCLRCGKTDWEIKSEQILQ